MGGNQARRRKEDGKKMSLDNESPTVRTVQLDGLVLLKIIKHCTENVPEVMTGQLLGLDVDGKLEVTNCFAIPSNDDDNTDEYQIEMMKNLRAVNVDNNTVGWYQSALLESFINQSMIESQYSYQKEIPNSVVVVYDPFRTTKGRLALKAYRLTSEFMELYEKGDLSSEAFTKLGLDSKGIFEEIPIKVHNSHLVHGFLYELRENKAMNCDYDRLRMSANGYLEKTLNIMHNRIDDYSSEQSKFQYLQRLIARQKQQNRDQDEESKTKVNAQPSRLDSFLISNQISNYCDQVSNTSALAFNKLYMLEALSKKN